MNPLPPIADVTGAARDTWLLLRLRTRMVRGLGPRLGMIFGIAFAYFMIWSAWRFGPALQDYAEAGLGGPTGDWVGQYVVALKQGELGALGSGALAAAFAAGFLSPFTSSGNLSLAPTSDVEGMRPRRLHRYFDSLITSAVSLIGFSQLLLLVTVASLLTFDIEREAALALTVATWPALILVTSAQGWLLEWARRALTSRQLALTAAFIITALGAAFALAPERGKTLFGLSTGYANLMRGAGQGQTGTVLTGLAVIVGVSVVALFVGVTMAQAALGRPAPTATRSTRTRKARRLPNDPTRLLVGLVAAHLWRQRETRRPLVLITLSAVGGALLSPTDTVLYSIVVAVPIAFAVAWVANVFGMFGPAMPWLATQPGFGARIVPVVTAVNIAAAWTVTAGCLAIPLARGDLDPGTYSRLAAGAAVATVVTTRAALSYAVRNPAVVRLGSRGDAVTPPVAALRYTLQLAATAAPPAIGIALAPSALIAAAIALGVVAWIALRYFDVLSRWRSREHQAYVIAAVSAT